MASFNDIDFGGRTASLIAALSAQGIKEPLPVQTEAIPRLLSGGNLVVQAPTGTGKTLAYLLPALARIDAEKLQAQTIVLAPTYELAMQIAKTAQELAQAAELPIRALGLIGGANIQRQMEKLKKKPQLIVGSAGRLIELAHKGKLKLQDVNFLVLDEFDRLLDDQNAKNTADIVQLVRRACGDHPIQYALFSATAPKKALERADFLDHPEVLRIEAAPAAAQTVEHDYRMTPFREKIAEIRKLTRRLGVKRGIVFINKTFDAERTLEKLRYDGITAVALLGHQGKQARAKALQDFRSGKATLLLSTDLAARGLDIADVDTVFNLDLPEDAKTYLHRAGRTGRAGKEGRVVTLADLKEALKLEKLSKGLGIEFRRMVSPKKKK